MITIQRISENWISMLFAVSYHDNESDKDLSELQLAVCDVAEEALWNLQLAYPGHNDPEPNRIHFGWLRSQLENSTVHSN